MPIPLIPVIAALAAGLVSPACCGGVIVSSAAGYVAGTYLSTAAIAAIVGGTVTAAGTTAAVVTGAAASVIGSAGIFGTTVGATGIKGALMSAGLIKSTPLLVPIAVGGAIAGFGYGTYRWLKLKRRLQSAVHGAELTFTHAEAKLLESAIKRIAKNAKSSDK